MGGSKECLLSSYNKSSKSKFLRYNLYKFAKQFTLLFVKQNYPNTLNPHNNGTIYFFPTL